MVKSRLKNIVFDSDFLVMNTVRKTLSNINKYKFTYILNASLLQFFITSVGFFVLGQILNLILIFSGQENINKNNFWQLFTNPLSILAIFTYLLCIAFLTFVEFSVITFMVYGKQKGTHFSIKTVMKYAGSNAKKIAGIQLVWFFVYFVLTIPLSNLGLSSAITEKLYIPAFITGEFFKTLNGSIMVITFMALAFYINLRLIFTLPLTVVNDDASFLANIRKSWQITKKNKIKLLITIGLLEASLLLPMFIFIILSMLALGLLDHNGNNAVMQVIFFVLIKSSLFFFLVISKIGIIDILISTIAKQKIISKKVYDHHNEEQFKSRMLLMFFIILVLGNAFVGVWKVYMMKINPNTAIIGHRGYDKHGVENSIESLEAAKMAGANFVEMDIIMTKDKKFVVSHDFNLKRVAGVDRNIADMNFNEVVNLPLRQRGFKSHLPSFEEFAEKSKKLDMNLFVELKPHGREPEDYYDIFIKEMKRLGLAEKSKVISIDQKTIETIEKKAPEFKTGYIIPLQFGDFNKTNVDFYVIEDFSYSERLAEQAKKDHKGIYVWTINEESKLYKYLQQPIDGIITDEVLLAKTVQEKLSNKESYLDRLLMMFDL